MLASTDSSGTELLAQPSQPKHSSEPEMRVRKKCSRRTVVTPRPCQGVCHTASWPSCSRGGAGWGGAGNVFVHDTVMWVLKWLATWLQPACSCCSILPQSASCVYNMDSASPKARPWAEASP